MIIITPDHCSDRPGVLEINTEDGWTVAAYLDSSQKSPAILKCEHCAFELQMHILEQAAQLASTGMLKPHEVPTPADFRFTHTDVVPAEFDAPVNDVQQAGDVIRDVLKGIRS